MQAISGNPALKKRFEAITDTRGIRAKDGSTYFLKGASHAALQGLPISLGLVDEVHLLKPDLWDALVSGTGGRADTLVFGITTAGDDDSELLKLLYANGEKALVGDDSQARFGFFVWESESTLVPVDDEELLRLLYQANPKLYEPYGDAENLLTDVRGKQEADVVRFHLNRFTSATSGLMTLELWGRCARESEERFPRPLPNDYTPVYFAVDVTFTKDYATIAVAMKAADGIVHTELVTTLLKPSLESILSQCSKLRANNPGAVFVVDSLKGRDLGIHLKQRGLPVRVIEFRDMLNAASNFYALTAQKRLRHSSDPLLSVQIPAAKRQNKGDAWRISPSTGGVEVDAVIATANAVYAAETTVNNAPQLFV